jgi:hypothetical protein
MDPVNFRAKTPLQALMVEQALAMAEELEKESDSAADGEVLSVVEQIALKRGREFMRSAVEASLQAQADKVEKKGHRVGYVPIAIVSDATKEQLREKF